MSAVAVQPGLQHVGLALGGAVANAHRRALAGQLARRLPRARASYRVELLSGRTLRLDAMAPSSHGLLLQLRETQPADGCDLGGFVERFAQIIHDDTEEA